MVTLKGQREKIENLENEKARLLGEVEKFRKEAEEKAAALECEVTVLREEAESLKKMLDESILLIS
jgi:predicted  nucleic acid-binding Zn-ribbon protein